MHPLQPLVLLEQEWDWEIERDGRLLQVIMISDNFNLSSQNIQVRLVENSYCLG